MSRVPASRSEGCTCTVCPEDGRSPAVTAASLDRQREDEAAALSGLALDPDPAAVQLDEALGEREPEPGAFSLLHADVGLLELLEDPLLVVGRDPRAGVGRRTPATSPSTREVATTMLPPVGVNLTAFESRLKTTWRNRRSSPSTRSTSGASSSESSDAALRGRARAPSRRRARAPRAARRSATSSSTWPASTLDRSSTSLISASRWLPDERMSSRYSSCFALSSPKSRCRSTCEKPMIAFSGVRSSCDMFARNSVLCRLAVSSSPYSRRSSSFIRLTFAARAPSSSRFGTSSVPREVAARDLREPRLRPLDRPDQRPGEDEAEAEREDDADRGNGDEEVARRCVRASVRGDERRCLVGRRGSKDVCLRLQVVVGRDGRTQKRAAISRRSHPGASSVERAFSSRTKTRKSCLIRLSTRSSLCRRYEAEDRLVRRRAELREREADRHVDEKPSAPARNRARRPGQRGEAGVARRTRSASSLPQLVRLRLERLVGGRPQLKRAQAFDAGIRLTEDSQSEDADEDEQRGDHEERDEQLRAQVGGRAGDGTHKAVPLSCERPHARRRRTAALSLGLRHHSARLLTEHRWRSGPARRSATCRRSSADCGRHPRPPRPLRS